MKPYRRTKAFRVMLSERFYEVWNARKAGRIVTPQQRRVGDLVALGFHTRDIADTLGIAVRTVKAHLRALYCVTGANGIVQLAVWWNCELFRIGLGLEEPTCNQNLQ